MFALQSLLLSVLLSSTAASSVPTVVEPTSWVPAMGDTFVVDTAENVGYIVREDKSLYTSFSVVTGQKRNVYYIGRYYYAKTPDKVWEVKTKHQKAKSVTFGDGRFLRLYDDGERTAYGIHGHRYAMEMLAEEPQSRYRSMGCVIVSDVMLDILEEIYHVNGEYLLVTTVDGFVDPFIEGTENNKI